MNKKKFEIQASVKRGECHQNVFDTETWDLIPTAIDEETDTDEETEAVTESHDVVGERSKIK